MQKFGFTLVVLTLTLTSCETSRTDSGRQQPKPSEHGVDLTQVPTWSSDDMRFFLHGSLGTEVIPHFAHA